jgi:hypothetical protein
MSLTPDERKLTVKGKNKAIICAFLIVLYKIDLIEGGEVALNQLPLDFPASS